MAGHKKRGSGTKRGSPAGKRRAGARPALAAQETVSVAVDVNGVSVALDVPAHERLLDTLRYRLGLTGTKEGCGEGECGACTVYLDGVPVNACLVPTYQVRGAAVRTIESVDSGELQPFLAHGATQCGACTPGVIMTACWVRDHPELLERHSIRELMAGNLCRCTGYDGIAEGLATALSPGTPSP